MEKLRGDSAAHGSRESIPWWSWLHPAAQPSPPSRLHPAAGQGWTLLAWGSGTVCIKLQCHSRCVLMGMCHRHLFSIIIAHAPRGQGRGVSFSSRDLSNSLGVRAAPCKQQGRTFQVTPWGLYTIILPAPHHVQLLLPPPGLSRKTPRVGFPFPGDLGVSTVVTWGATRDGTLGTGSAVFPSHLWVHPWSLLPPLASWAFPTLPAQAQHPPPNQKHPWHHHSHLLGHLRAEQGHLKGDGSG